jgi:hypothetical protein
MAVEHQRFRKSSGSPAIFTAIRRASSWVVQLVPRRVGWNGWRIYIFNSEGRPQSAAAVFTVQEGSMIDLHKTSNPKRTAQIDIIGWLFVAFVVVVTAIAGMVTVSHIVGSAS